MIDVVCLSLSGSPLAWQILSFIIHSSSHTLARSIRRGWGRGLSLNFFCPLDGRCRCTQPDIIQTARSFCPSGQLISVRPERPTESWQYLFGLPPRHICVLDDRRLGPLLLHLLHKMKRVVLRRFRFLRNRVSGSFAFLAHFWGIGTGIGIKWIVKGIEKESFSDFYEPRKE